MSSLSYEEQFGPCGRRVRRAIRAVRWCVKGWLGRPRTFLVELNWRLGDEIMALPVLDALHAALPGDNLAVWTHYPDLFEDNPALGAVNPPAPSPDRYLLLRGASRREKRWQSYGATAGVPVPARLPRLYFSDWHTPKLDGLPPGCGPLIAIAPGASWPSKRWPQERWVALVERLERQGARVIVLGQAGEGLGSGSDLTGQTSVREAACLLHACALCVCCDSGLMHLALAVGTPVVALFGPTDPDFLVRPQPGFTALRSTLPCSGFWNHAETASAPGLCPEGHACCLESITVDDAWEAVVPLLSAEAR